MELWSKQVLQPSLTYRWAVGPLEMWLRGERDELHVATKHGDEAAEAHRLVPFEPCEPSVDGLDWARWIVHPDGTSMPERLDVQLVPVMPDRAVVARPESPLRLPMGTAALFFVSIPVWVRLLGHGQARGASGKADEPVLTLSEFPSLVLSNIWFGDAMSGELCYSLTTTARRQIEDESSRPHRARCPVYLRNDSEQELNIQRIRVHVAHLSVFDAGRRLWTNRVNITYKGEEAGSQMEFVPGPPQEADGPAIVVGEPREPAQRRFWTRAFAALDSLF